jgi:hypothetical protein
VTLAELKLAFPLHCRVQLTPESQRFARTLGEKGTVEGHTQWIDVGGNEGAALLLRIDGRRHKQLSQPSQWERTPTPSPKELDPSVGGATGGERRTIR